jgi:peptide/nickel transport system substrate-binding protein
VRKTQTRWRKAIGAGAITGFLLAGSLGGVHAADPVTFKIGITEAPSGKGLNPFQALLTEDYSLMAVTYDLLIEFGPELQPAPGLATSWDVTDGGTTWTYHIREGVTWQDGQPFTAEDARFTLQYIWDSHDPAYKGPAAPDGNDTDGDGEADHPLTLFDSYIDLDNGIAKSHIKSIEAPDATTLVIKTSAPIITLSQMYIPILAKHIWNNITFADASKKPLTPDQAIGTGPFHVTSFDPKQAVTLEANKNFWGGAPHIDQVIYQYFGNDDAQVNALVSGDVDMLDSFPPGLISALQDQPGITLNIAKSANFGELGFNSWDPTPQRFKKEGCKDCPKGPTTGSLGNPWLTKPEVREAITGLIDKKALVQQAFQGYADPAISIVSPLNPLYAYQPPANDPATFPDYADDASQATARAAANDRFTQAMGALGFSDTDGDGILNAPNTPEAQAFDPDGAGKNFELRLFAREDDQEDKLAAELMKTWFEDAGIKINYKQVSEDPGLYNATIPSYQNNPSDMYLWGWGPDPDPNFILSIFACNQINGWQDADYCDPAYDQMYQDQRLQTDLEVRADIVRQMQDKVYHDAPYAVLWYENILQAYRSDKWEGFNPVPSTGGDIWSAYGFGPWGSLVSAGPLGAAGGTPPPIETPAPSSEPGTSPSPGETATASETPLPSSSSAPAASPSAGATAVAETPAGATPTAAAATPAPGVGATPTAAPSPAPLPSPSAAGGTGGSGGNNTGLLIGAVVLVIVVVGAVWYMRRKRDEDDDE